ncbi:hypothetical protein CPARA_2gp283 (nucleomorph) [Cryptomonas paramecium]|uniref:Uncharacterized protein n=1 Tax=Cryptomonas paramaecium TaxID=2898 RepID=F2HHZ5_9CRYP|nr:hypothetical protein CPARA_2gp283 [Cryptomonas paramecium]AEA38941.1 hypothetical protein CPARA_2gp283 [Cryptomonas paramecium]|mmetsp:Transcript_52419/g.137249  ORF Transcript_52419/g.137249 Transcript_52419/m.137249 type:complete len:142 (-) Transcript_52419:6880-7305(-)
MIRKITSLVKKANLCHLENIRYNLNLNLEICDKSKKKIFSNQNFVFKLKNKILTFKQQKTIESKTNLIYAIKNSTESIHVSDVIKNYFNIKLDLLSLVKYTEKERILILIKKKNFQNLLIFPHGRNYIFASTEDLINWHKI